MKRRAKDPREQHRRLRTCSLDGLSESDNAVKVSDSDRSDLDLVLVIRKNCCIEAHIISP